MHCKTLHSLQVSTARQPQVNRLERILCRVPSIGIRNMECGIQNSDKGDYKVEWNVMGQDYTGQPSQCGGA